MFKVVAVFIFCFVVVQSILFKKDITKSWYWLWWLLLLNYSQAISWQVFASLDYCFWVIDFGVCLMLVEFLLRTNIGRHNHQYKCLGYVWFYPYNWETSSDQDQTGKFTLLFFIIIGGVHSWSKQLIRIASVFTFLNRQVFLG